jgi:putative DNA primase/helicase
MHAVRSPVAGSGKSYLLDIVAAISIGQAMPVIAVGRSEEETEKRLGARLLTGQPLLALDNVNGELSGDFLCQAIERPYVLHRILGKSEEVRIESRGTTLFANGNNLTIVGDLCRRVITSSLDPLVERPELREFAHDPVADVLANRGAYVAAVLTICRAFVVAGRPGKAPHLGSFEEWSDLVRSALMWLGEADPVATMETARAEDPKAAELAAVLRA